MSIYKKLLELQKHCKGLGKDSKSFSYQYVSGNKVLGVLRPKMDDLGLILKQEVISIENSRMDYAVKNGQKSEILTKVEMKFTWIDCETGEKDENYFAANGMNDWEKGLGSALTYAERYFLLKFFHIATDEDDIDNPDRKPEQHPEPAQPQKQEKKKAVFSIATVKDKDKLLQWLYDMEQLAIEEKRSWTLLRQLETLYIVDSKGEDFKSLTNLYNLKKTIK